MVITLLIRLRMRWKVLSECGTWSHAVIPSLGARARGGVVGRLRSVSHVVGPSQGSGLMGWVGSRWVPSGYSSSLNKRTPGYVFYGKILERGTCYSGGGTSYYG